MFPLPFLPCRIWCLKKITAYCLTPSLPQPVKFPGRKMHGPAYKQYIFKSCSTATFNAMYSDENPFTCKRGKPPHETA